MNLLKETIEKLQDEGKNPQDVMWVGSRSKYFSWDHFKKIADREYDESYGSEEVYPGLLIVGNSWWLERHEYDGSEWWEYKEYPTRPKDNVEVSNLFVDDHYNFPEIED
jgi:hypothetical protein